MPGNKRSVGFFRDFRLYTGGHGKVFDYFQHVLAHPSFAPRIHFTGRSVRDASNPWKESAAHEDASWRPERYDVLFLAGLDWQHVAREQDSPSRPVFNLVQHVRHGDSGDERYAFLLRPAIRVCVSDAVAEAIVASGRVNGPIHVIPAAVNLPELGARTETIGDNSTRVFIAGQKSPVLAHNLAERLRELPGLHVQVSTDWLAREDFLDRVRSADIAVMLPHEREGFYLPALEAMQLGTAVVVPDCLGNRGYVRNGENCLVPVLAVESLSQAVVSLQHDHELRARLMKAGRITAARHSLAAERAAFHAILDRLDSEWMQCRHAT